MNARTVYALLLLLAVGSLQMVGDVCGLRAIKAIGAASLASPAPKVFSAVGGFETYSTRFRLAWTDAGGAAHSLLITPAVGARLRGPYLRRNVYGAALAYGPVLAMDPVGQRLLDAVLVHGLRGASPLLRELGIDPASVREVELRYEPVAGAAAGTFAKTIQVPR